MKYAISARVTSEVCLALLIYCLFAPAGAQFWALAAFAAVLHVCGVAAERFDRPVPRLLCCLPAALLLAATVLPADLIVLSVCWLYAAIRFASGRFAVERWAYRREFAVLTAVNALVSLLIAGRVIQPQTPRATIGFAAASVLLGIYALRAIRSGLREKPGWSAYSVLELALPLGAAAGISALLWLFFQGAYSVLLWLAGLVKEPAVPELPTSPSEYHYTPFYVESKMFFGRPGQKKPDQLPEPTTVPEPEAADNVLRLPPYVWLIIILVVLSLAALLIVLRLRKKKAAQRSAENGEEDETELTRRGRRGKSVSLSPDRRIRKAYRAYLRFLQQAGQDIRKSDTSQDVLTGSVRGDSEEERELRGLYLAARYSDGSAVREADASRAEALLNAICGRG